MGAQIARTSPTPVSRAPARRDRRRGARRAQARARVNLIRSSRPDTWKLISTAASTASRASARATGSRSGRRQLSQALAAREVDARAARDRSSAQHVGHPDWARRSRSADFRRQCSDALLQPPPTCTCSLIPTPTPQGRLDASTSLPPSISQGVVLAKDSPNFIATTSLYCDQILKHVESRAYTSRSDAITRPPLGRRRRHVRPDLAASTSGACLHNLYERLPDKPAPRVCAAFQKMV